jgi:hypothetical protein
MNMNKWTFFSIAIVCFTVESVSKTLFGRENAPCQCERIGDH